MTESAPPFDLLIIEDDAGFANILRKRLVVGKHEPGFAVEVAGTLAAALVRLERSAPDIVLLDLSLPDSKGLEALVEIRARYQEVPIVVLTGVEDESVGLEAIRRGAQDYLLKGKVNAEAITRVLLYSLERSRLQKTLLSRSLRDEVTDFHNRRAFFALGEQQLRWSQRSKTVLTLILIRLDGLESLRESGGREGADAFLAAFAAFLKQRFRDTDFLSRVGGNEIAILTSVPRERGSITLRAWMVREMEGDAGLREHASRISLKIGMSTYDPLLPCTVTELVTRAEQALSDGKAPVRASSAPAGAAAGEASPGTGAKKILIVDDDDAVRAFLSLRLSHAGYEVQAASDGEKGLEAAHRWTPDLVILDLMLPKKSGEQICKAIREDRNKDFAATPILMLTGKSSDVDRVIGKVIGANAYITKPFNPETLLYEVKRLTGSG